MTKLNKKALVALVVLGLAALAVVAWALLGEVIETP